MINIPALVALQMIQRNNEHRRRRRQEEENKPKRRPPEEKREIPVFSDDFEEEIAEGFEFDGIEDEGF